MNRNTERNTGSLFFLNFLSLTALLSVILSGCGSEQKRNVSLKALELFCRDPANDTLCEFEHTNDIGLRQWPHATILLFESEFEVAGSRIYLPNDGGNCGFDDMYDPRYYTINTDGGLYYRAVSDNNGDGQADPALTTIRDNDLTPVPSPVPPEPGYNTVDTQVLFLCAENLTMREN